jgi:hypothetical protein
VSADDLFAVRFKLIVYLVNLYLQGMVDHIFAGVISVGFDKAD